MKSNVVQLVLALMALVLGGAAEELLPKVAGIGFPVLLAAALFFAVRRGTAEAVVFALAAGALEDALSALPPGTSPVFFLAAIALARRCGFPHSAHIMFFPAYQLWLTLWFEGATAGVFVRMLASVPAGWLAASAAGAALAWAQRKAAIDVAR